VPFDALSYSGQRDHQAFAHGVGIAHEGFDRGIEALPGFKLRESRPIHPGQAAATRWNGSAAAMACGSGAASPEKPRRAGSGTGTPEPARSLSRPTITPAWRFKD